MHVRKKVLNPRVFVELLCYVAFAGLILHLVSSGRYQSYVTPKMVPYLYFTALVMLVWAGGGVFRLFRPQHKIRLTHCFVLVIPILLLLLPHKPLSTSDLSLKYMGAGLTGQGPSGNSDFNAPTGLPTPSSDISGLDNNASAPPDPRASDAQTGGQEDISAGEDALDLPGLDAKNKKITVPNDYFYPWLAEIYVNMEKYAGYQISITGFVFKDPDTMANNEFAAARLAMSCCVADLTPCGMLCQYGQTSELKADTWVTVEGVIHKGQYMGYDEPKITVTRISPAEEVKGYIYPF